MDLYPDRIVVKVARILVRERWNSALASLNLIQNEQIEADVEQLMDLMKTRKKQLENLLNEKMKDFGLLCALENVRFFPFSYLSTSSLLSFSKLLVLLPTNMWTSKRVISSKNWNIMSSMNYSTNKFKKYDFDRSIKKNKYLFFFLRSIDRQIESIETRTWNSESNCYLCKEIITWSSQGKFQFTGFGFKTTFWILYLCERKSREDGHFAFVCW